MNLSYDVMVSKLSICLVMVCACGICLIVLESTNLVYLTQLNQGCSLIWHQVVPPYRRALWEKTQAKEF